MVIILVFIMAFIAISAELLVKLFHQSKNIKDWEGIRNNKNYRTAVTS
jgi:hypothetical protein